MLSYFSALLLLLSATCTLSAPQVKLGGPVVSLPQGDVEGLEITTGNGKTYYGFQGIPFGKADRFAAPTPAGNWFGTLDGTQDPPACYQPIFGVPMTGVGSEDCLTVSVYTPSLTGGPYKVHVFIHGGMFLWGDIWTNKYSPDRLIDYTDIVVVLIQYRLGALGFLSTGDASAPGNFGLWDQNLGLKWVQDNVAYFGGDPSAVTLTGESAGAVSVSSQILSPKSQGLFHQAILESGSAFVPWGVVEDPLPYAQTLASKFDCNNTDTQLLIDCLRRVPADELTVKEFDVVVETLYLPWAVVVDGDFIPDTPANLLSSGNFNQVPLIQGFNRDEGCIVYMFIPYLFSNIDDAFFNDVLPLLVRTLTDYRTNLVDISYAIKDEYYNIDLTDPAAVTRASVDLISDMIIKVGSVQAIQYYTKYVPVYMYEFNYQGAWSPSNATGASDATHAVELIYIYNNTADAPPLDAADSAFSRSFVQLWGDFNLKGNPTPIGSDVNWPNTPDGETTYFNIDAQFSVSNGYDVDKMNFWLVRVPSIANA